MQVLYKARMIWRQNTVVRRTIIPNQNKDHKSHKVDEQKYGWR